MSTEKLILCRLCWYCGDRLHDEAKSEENATCCDECHTLLFHSTNEAYCDTGDVLYLPNFKVRNTRTGTIGDFGGIVDHCGKRRVQVIVDGTGWVEAESRYWILENCEAFLREEI